MLSLRNTILTVIYVLLFVLHGTSAEATVLKIVEYGAKDDGHGTILLRGLRATNIPGALAVTDDDAVWFTETLSWHPRIVRIDRNGTFREFPDPYDYNIPPYRWTGPALSHFGPVFPKNPYDWQGFGPLVAQGNNVLAIPRQHDADDLTVLQSLSPDGATHMQAAKGCLTAGPDIGCFPRSAEGAPVLHSRFYRPNSVALGPDGNLWFADDVNSLLGRVTREGRYSAYTQGLTRWQSGPQFITVGPDGNLWFTEQRDRVGRITPGGRIIDYPVTDGGRELHRTSIGGIAAGPDGNLWFTLYHGNDLGRITTAGVMTIYHHVVYPSQGHDSTAPVAMLARDRQGRLYYNEGEAGRIARVTIVP